MLEGVKIKIKRFEDRLHNLGEVFRESLNKVVLLIGIVTLVAPYGTFFHGEGTISILALFWAVLLPEVWGYSGLQVFNLDIMPQTLAFGSLTIVYAIAVINYCKNPKSRRLVLFTAVLSVLLTTLQAMFTYDMILRTGLQFYIGPIPIQLVIGLCLVYVCTPRIEETPW